MLQFLRSRLGPMSIIAILIPAVFFIPKHAKEDFGLLTSPHKFVYPTSVSVENRVDARSLVKYTYSIGDREIKNEQTVFASYLWLNSFYTQDKQFGVIYSRDTPETSLLLGNLYLKIFFDLLLVLVAMLLLLLYELFLAPRLRKQKAPPPPTPPPSDDVIKHT